MGRNIGKDEGDCSPSNFSRSNYSFLDRVSQKLNDEEVRRSCFKNMTGPGDYNLPKYMGQT